MENKLSADEQQFIDYWEKNRQRQKRVTNQFMVGLPLGIIFAAPVLLNLFTGWHKKAGLEINTRLNPAVILLAVLLIVAFVAIFSRRHKWDQHELHYRELLAKRGQDREDTQKNDPEIASAPAAKQED